MTRVRIDRRRPASLTVRPAGLARLAAAIVLGLLVAASGGFSAAAQPATARVLYERAVARDRAVREAMSDPRASSGLSTKPFRDAIAAYRLVVWRHPTSGYCDNALWQGALLAIEAYDRFAQDADRQTALTLLRMLVKEYPSSSLVARARTTASRVEGLPAAPPPARAAAPPVPPDPPGQAAPVVSIAYVQRSALPDLTEIVIYLDGPATFHQERLGQPDRVFFDLAGTRPAESLKDAVLDFDAGLVRQIRIGRHPNSVTRLVMDSEGVGQVRARMYTEPHRLVVTCWPAGVTPPPEPAASGPGRDAPVQAVPATSDTTRPVPVVVETPAGRSAAPPAAEPPAPPAASRPDASPTGRPAPTVTPSPPSSNVRGGFSLARQLGLGANRIVIDPGHGGRDPGTIHRNLTEAALTLDIALRLEALLAKQPGIEVVLTRRTDVFLSLQERTEIANREEADLFVSIHVNASRNRAARGIETYLLDFASTPDAEAVAARENASSVMTMTSLNDLVKKIALTNKADESRDLAVLLQNSMVRRLRPHNTVLKDLGVKRAPFIVLIGASMPSVLVEVAFLTHAQEGRLISRQAYRQRVAESLFDGIRRYLDSLKKAPPVVLQRQPDRPAVPSPGARDREPVQ